MGYIDTGLVAPTLNDASAATANTTKLQAALTAGGKVQFVGVGTAYVNAPLVIGSNTELSIPAGLTLKQAAGASNNMLRSAAYNGIIAGSAPWNTLYDNSGTITTGPLAMIWSGSITAWAQSTAVTLGTYKSANGNVYWCAVAGTTSGSGTGPATTGTGIVDGTATWNYVTAYPTLSGAGSLTAIVHWPSHGATVGKSLWITPQPDTGSDNSWSGTQAAGTRGGPCDSAYFGTFWVPAVNDTNYLTVTLRRVPAAGFTGIPINVKYADQNIVINCNGVFDCDYTNQSPLTFQSQHAAIIAGVQGLKINGLNAANVGKYVLSVCGIAGFDIGHVQGGFAGSNSDQVKSYNAFDGIFHDIYGTGGDDVISLQTTAPSPFLGDIIANGDILGIDITRVGNVSGAGVSILPDHALLLMDNITVSKVTTHDALASNRVSPVKLYSDITPAGPIGMLRIRDVEARDGDIGLFTNQGLGSLLVDHLLIEACSTRRNGTTGALCVLTVQSGATVNIKKLTIRDCQATLRATTDYCIFFNKQAGGTFNFDKIDIEDNYVVGASAGFGAMFNPSTNNAVTIGKITFSNNDFTSMSWIGRNMFGECDFVGNKMATVNTIFECGVAGSNLRFSRNSWDTAVTSGIVRFTAAVAINVYSDGTNKLASGSTAWFAYPFAGTAAGYGWDIQMDITKSVRAVGSYFYNTNAAPGSGTIAAVGPVMNDGTTAANSFHLMADPTKVY